MVLSFTYHTFLYDCLCLSSSLIAVILFPVFKGKAGLKIKQTSRFRVEFILITSSLQFHTMKCSRKVLSLKQICYSSVDHNNSALNIVWIRFIETFVRYPFIHFLSNLFVFLPFFYRFVSISLTLSPFIPFWFYISQE